MELKRYWLFGGDHYYPRGGMMDFIASSDDLEDFDAYEYEDGFSDLNKGLVLKNDPFRNYGDGVYGLQWYHVLDSEENEIIFCGQSNCVSYLKDHSDQVECSNKQNLEEINGQIKNSDKVLGDLK